MMSEDTRYFVCDHCKAKILATEDYGEPPLTLCRRCRGRYYDHCVVCGCFAERELLHYPGGGNQGYCDECFVTRYTHNKQ